MEINLSFLSQLQLGYVSIKREREREILMYLNLFILSIRCLYKRGQYFNYFNQLAYYIILIKILH